MNKWNLREVKYLPQGYSNNASQLVATAVGRLCFCGYTPHRASLLPVLSFVVSFFWIFCFTFILRCLQRRSYFGIDSWLRMPSAVSSRNKNSFWFKQKRYLFSHNIQSPEMVDSTIGWVCGSEVSLRCKEPGFAVLLLFEWHWSPS